MINPLAHEIEAPPRQAQRPRVLQGGAIALDIEHLSQTMAMLEDYVDGVLALDGPPGMDPWVDDLDLETRMACL
jgi:hypothetical protein